jgi:phospholipid transport system substrate-binding protein
MRHFWIAGIVAGLISTVALATAAAPDVLVRTNTDEIIARIKKNKDAYAKDQKKLYAMVDELVLPHFDFRKMSQLVLRQAWREASEEQRARFTQEFRDLLVRTYATALLKYNNEEVIYKPYKGPNEDKTAEVHIEVKPSGGAPNVPIEYAFYTDKAGAWKVYDVKIDGISLVINYKEVYAKKVREEGLEVLIAQLARDNKEGKTDKPIAPAPSEAKVKK